MTNRKQDPNFTKIEMTAILNRVADGASLIGAVKKPHPDILAVRTPEKIKAAISARLAVWNNAQQAEDPDYERLRTLTLLEELTAEERTVDELLEIFGFNKVRKPRSGTGSSRMDDLESRLEALQERVDHLDGALESLIEAQTPPKKTGLFGTA